MSVTPEGIKIVQEPQLSKEKKEQILAAVIEAIENNDPDLLVEKIFRIA